MDPSAIAQIILAGFHSHFSRFSATTRAASDAFSNANWSDISALNRARTSFYDMQVEQTAHLLHHTYQQASIDEPLWLKVKEHFELLCAFHPQARLAQSFYNSVFCRCFHRRYFNNDFIFVAVVSRMDAQTRIPGDTVFSSYYPVISGLKPTIRDILNRYDFKTPYINLERDIRALVKAFVQQAPATRKAPHQLRIDMVNAPFYRNKAAYLVGRIVSSKTITPFIIPVLHKKGEGIYLDALLTQEQDMRVLFGFARSYFMVNVSEPCQLVRFLQDLMPNKTKAELYNAIGFHKQGKTEFYRELLQHLDKTDDQFKLADGIPGLVMEVFTLPSLGFVFKMIRDEFPETKPFGPETVKARYRLVKQHDKVGRMADTMEFSDVVLPLERISPSLLTALKASVPSKLRIEGGNLVLKHVYIERRMTPLNLYLENATFEEKDAAMKEYGYALKDMLSVNIFPGDMLLKNFGYTRHKRVIFYDYDEVRYLDEMTFRAMPKEDPHSISVGAGDVFPEQLLLFVTTNQELRTLLLKHHPELATPEFWQQMQAKAAISHGVDIFPYPDKYRFKH